MGKETSEIVCHDQAEQGYAMLSTVRMYLRMSIFHNCMTHNSINIGHTTSRCHEVTSPLAAFSVEAKAASSPVPAAPDTYKTAAVVLTGGLDDSARTHTKKKE